MSHGTIESQAKGVSVSPVSPETATPDPEVRVVDHPEKSRFEAYLGDELAGYVKYRHKRDLWVLPSTRVFDQFGGRGVGGRLVVGTLTQIRERGGSVDPVCPFIPRVISDNPDFRDLVPAELRPRYGL